MDLFKGSRSKYSRALGRKVDNRPEDKDPLSRRGPIKRRSRKKSDFGLHLTEVQICRITYGIYERQFRNYFKKAKARPGNTAESLLELLERRLDNAIYRCGLAASRKQARQLVVHRHFLVNGRAVDKPSYNLRPGDTIEVKGSKAEKPFYKEASDEIVDPKAGFWIQRQEGGGYKYKIDRYPSADEAEKNFDAAYIVEYYSKYV